MLSTLKAIKSSTKLSPMALLRSYAASCAQIAIKISLLRSCFPKPKLSIRLTEG
jgi:hypothetical protein